MGVRSLRWVLLVSLWAAAAALLVALVVGSTTNADSSSAADTPTVAAPTEEQAPAGDDEVVGLRTEQSKTFRRDDGSLTTRVYPEAVHYQDGGDWREIDNTLVSGDSGYMHRRANDGDAQIPRSLDDPFRFSHDGDTLSIQMQDAEATASVDGEHATYDGVADGVDADYQAINGGLREQLTLADAAARSAFTYKIRAGAGLSPTDEADGSITFRNADGAVAFRLGAPVVWDSAQPAAVSHATTLHIAAAADGDGWLLTLAVDHDWLASPDRRFPVTVDPDVYWSDSGLRFHGAQLDCTLADGSSAATSLCADSTLRVGHDASHNYRSNLYFNVRSAIPQDAVIYDATLSLFDPGTAAQSSSNLRVRALGAGWTGAATWNTRDGSTSWTTPGGDLTGNPGIATGVGHQGYWYYFDVPTEAIQSWAWGDSADDGIQLAADAGAPQQVYSFVSTEGNQAQWPAVDIDWEDPRGLDGPYTNDSQALSDHSQLAVNVANGGLTYTERDASLSASGADDVRVTRSWRSAMNNGWGHYGRGWYDGATISSLWPEDDGSVNWVSPGGSSFRFTPGTGNSYNSPAGAPNLTLCKTSWSGCSASGFSDLAYRLTDSTTNTSYLFYDTGLQRAQVDSHGNVVNTVQTSSSTTITATASRTISQPNNANGMASRTSDGSHTWTYNYGGSDGTILRSATAPGSGGGTTQYAYTGNLLTTITDPAGRQTQITWETPAVGNPHVTKVVRVLDPAHPTDTTKNPTTTYTYNTATRTTVVTDPAGNATATPTDDGQTTYTYDKYEHVTTASPKTSALPAAPAWAASDANWDTTRPTSTPSGDLTNLADTYVDGRGTTDIVLGATDPAGTDGSISGIRRVALEEGANASQPLASQTTCADTAGPPRTCPAAVTVPVSLDETVLTEGAHTFRQVTQDLAGNTSISAPWTDDGSTDRWGVIVDRSGPPAATEIGVDQFDAAAGHAIVSWDEGTDPDLADGTPGSGIDFAEARHRSPGGTWTDFHRTADIDNLDLSGVHDADQVEVEVRTVDMVGNVSPVANNTVTIADNPDNPIGVVDYDIDDDGNPVGGAQARAARPFPCVLGREGNVPAFVGGSAVPPDAIVHGESFLSCDDPRGALGVERMKLRMCIKVTGYHDEDAVSVVCDERTREFIRDGAAVGTLKLSLDIPCRPGQRSYSNKVTGSIRYFVPEGFRTHRDKTFETDTPNPLMCNSAGAWRYLGQHSVPYTSAFGVFPTGWKRLGDARRLSSPSATLGGSKKRAGDNPPESSGYAAHHMVATGYQTRNAPLSQAAAYDCHINPNNNVNGVWLPSTADTASRSPRAYHPTLHTERYFIEVATYLAPHVHGNHECDPRDAKEELQAIKGLLETNSFPYRPDDTTTIDPDD